MREGPKPVSLTVQAVLYHTEFRKLKAVTEALAAAVRQAETHGILGDFAFAVGDSSPVPCLSKSQVDELQAILGKPFLYQFFKENLGHGGGQNRLAELSQADRLLFLNPDGLVAPNTLHVLLDTIGDPRVGLAEARQLPIEHPKEYDQKTGDTAWAAGACLMCRADLFQQISGFDSATFFMYCDDVDLSWRIRLAGYRVVFCPSTTVFHPKRLSPETALVPGEAERYYSVEARLFLLHKYSRPDLLERELKTFQRNGDPYQMKAAAEFFGRRADGRLPSPLDPEHKVATFVEHEYARHRFVL